MRGGVAAKRIRVPNNSDGSSAGSVRIGKGIIERLGFDVKTGKLEGQTAGRQFEEPTNNYLREAFGLLAHLRPGEWEFSLGGNIRDYEQYLHLSDVSQMVKQHEELRIIFGDYIVTPDIVVCRKPVSDQAINKTETLVGDGETAIHTPLRSANSAADIMHASVFFQVDDSQRPLPKRTHRGVEPGAQPQRENSAHRGRLSVSLFRDESPRWPTAPETLTAFIISLYGN